VVTFNKDSEYFGVDDLHIFQCYNNMMVFPKLYTHTFIYDWLHEIRIIRERKIKEGTILQGINFCSGIFMWKKSMTQIG
jgi:hypothetical protein